MFGRRRKGESEDLRTFIRELLLRSDRNWEIMDARWHARFEKQREENRRYFEQLHAQGERESRRIDDLLSESRAQREALFRILDRLDGNGGTAPAG